MKRIVLLWLVASSVGIGYTAHAATRPRYGGILRISVQAAPLSLDPSDPVMAGTHAGEQVSRALFDTLVSLDQFGMPQPSLATHWESDPGGQRWRFSLRSGVRFGDDSLLTAEIAASSLRSANPSWRVSVENDEVVIETNLPVPDLLAQLALARNGIAKRNGTVQGTGPFTIEEWQPGKRLSLIARENYWAGRAFLNSVVIMLGQSYRDQRLALELSKADVVELPPEQATRAVADGSRVESSRAMELIALVFAQEARSREEARLRKLLASSLDRASMNSVLLQNSGEAANGLLPNWMTGYEFLFSADTSDSLANQAQAGSGPAIHWRLAYDASDPTLRIIAERVMLSARGVAIALDSSNGGAADLRLMQAPLNSLNAETALRQLAERCELAKPALRGDVAAAAYTAESDLLASGRVIPLVHSRLFYGLSKQVRNWDKFGDAEWHLEDVWREAAAP